MRIALALSGGGFRATVFHLGVLARLAQENRLEEVSLLSTVSGGSLCVGLVLAQSQFVWPTSRQLLETVVPGARELLTQRDFGGGYIRRVLRRPWTLLWTRAGDMSALIREQWGVSKPLGELPIHPRWMINATCYETAKNWRFERFRMGDSLFGYTEDTTDFPLSDAMTASAAFPGVIGALAVETSGRRWFRYQERDKVLLEPSEHMSRAKVPLQPEFPRAHLWDGGLYDNLGLEGLHNFNEGWRDDVDFLLVSDASGRPVNERFRPGLHAIIRIITGILMGQVRSLRTRAILERLKNHPEDRGSFLQIDNWCGQILRGAKSLPQAPEQIAGCLPETQVKEIATMPTDIRRMTTQDFDLLFRHGFEVADCTLSAFHPGEFKFIGFAQSAFGQV